MAIEPLEQSTVLSEDERQADRPTVRAIPSYHGYYYLIRGSGGAGCESTLPRAAPKFYEFAHIKVPHTARITASQLPPEQHIGVGGTDHGKTHVRFTRDNTVPDSY